ncbi:alpha/beta hydrolase [Yeosuana sp. AK3]
MKTKLCIFLLFFSFKTFSQEFPFSSQDVSVNPMIDGTLLIPKHIEKPNLVIIIAGSGPTDRNGNQSYLKNNSLKKLAEELSNNHIATFRYDKRVIKQLKLRNIDYNIKFDDFVTDAIAVLDYFKQKNAFNKIFVLGHSQGSLIGMIAAKDKANGFISVAGVAQTIDHVIIEQITKTYPVFVQDTKQLFMSLREGKKTDNYPPELASVFNKDIQGFMMNWMKYNPQDEVKKLNIPILILHGTKDLQVESKEATMLHESAANSDMKLIENMNHVLVDIEGDALENSKSYTEAYRKVSPMLIKEIIGFIK